MSSQKAVSYFEQKLQYEAEMGMVKRIVDEGDDKYLLVDVRSSGAFSEAHIPGAVNIPRAELQNRLTELSKDKIIITYCYHAYCLASAKAALELAKNGFSVMEMPGGFDEWQKRQNPVHSKSAPKQDIKCAC